MDAHVLADWLTETEALAAHGYTDEGCRRALRVVRGDGAYSGILADMMAEDLRRSLSAIAREPSTPAPIATLIGDVLPGL